LILKVTRVALENAASVAGMILTTECALIDIEDNGGGHNGVVCQE
jgi:chaperonin GroEL